MFTSDEAAIKINEKYLIYFRHDYFKVFEVIIFWSQDHNSDDGGDDGF